MLLANNRIELDARPAPQAQTVLEVVMLGHCPARPAQKMEGHLSAAGLPATVSDAMAVVGNIRWDTLGRDQLLLTEIASLGFASETARLRQLVQALDSPARGEEQKIALQPQDESLMALYNLPIPLYSFGQFQALFPEAFDTATQYRSVLGGERAWLPLAVQDFFENSNGDHPLKLWIIRVPELAMTGEQATHNVQAFLPNAAADMLEPETLGAFERALLIPRAAIMALPDLERLQVPAHLEDIPRLRLDNPEPVFLPCGSEVDGDHRERRYGKEIPKMPEPLDACDVLVPIARSLARLRPDMQCLLTVALAATPGSERPGPDPKFLACVAKTTGRKEDGTLDYQSLGPLTAASRHLQLLYPYLRGPDRKLGTAAGLVAGMQAAVSQQHGPWRSIGERPLPGRCLPWPPLNQNEATTLRNRPGVTVLLHRSGRTVVDDERMCAPCLPMVALQQLNRERRNDEHWRSAEIMRFMGWLRRELQALGERMIFAVDPRDPRPALALRAFFSRLHRQGALHGRRAEDSFTLTQQNDGEGVIAFDIEIAPAYPIDRLRITFMQDRHSAVTSTSVEVANA